MTPAYFDFEYSKDAAIKNAVVTIGKGGRDNEFC